MSLYDDIIVNKSEESGNSSTPKLWPPPSSSSIKLLHDHLQLKKRMEREQSNKKIPHALNKNVTKSRQLAADEMPPPPVISLSDDLKTGSLLGGDWDIRQEYDPFKPNDYEKLAKERKDKREKEERQKVAAKKASFPSPTVTSMVPGRKLVDGYSDDEDDVPTERPSSSRTSGAAIPPPPSLNVSTTSASSIASNAGVSFVAAKIMTKMGYKEGSGLGRENQGISRALTVQKTGTREGKIVSDAGREPSPSIQVSSPVVTSPSTEQAGPSIMEMIRNPAKVVLLKNMVGPGEVDEDLEPEVKEECGAKYGEVVKCVIFELPGPGVVPEEAVRIFVEFKRIESAIKAVVDLNGRFFGGRKVMASFYDPEKFRKLELT